MMRHHEAMATQGHHFAGHGQFGILILLALAAALVIPLWRLLPRHGIPAWISFFAIFPPCALLLLWVVSFREETKG